METSPQPERQSIKYRFQYLTTMGETIIPPSPVAHRVVEGKPSIDLLSRSWCFQHTVEPKLGTAPCVAKTASLDPQGCHVRCKHGTPDIYAACSSLPYVRTKSSRSDPPKWMTEKTENRFKVAHIMHATLIHVFSIYFIRH